MLQMEHDIAFFAELIGEKNTLERFVMASQARKEAITSIFWNEQMGQWLDYWLNDSNSCLVEFWVMFCLDLLNCYCTQIFLSYSYVYLQDPHIWDASNQNQNVFASNFIPLWIKPFYSGMCQFSLVLSNTSLQFDTINIPFMNPDSCFRSFRALHFCYMM